jgi:hypothetical protein
MSEVASAPAGGRARPHPSHTLGMRLERDRLECRLRRVTTAVAELHRLANDQRHELGQPTTPIHHAIRDFEALAAAIHARLQELAATGETVDLQNARSDQYWHSDPSVARTRFPN